MGRWNLLESESEIKEKFKNLKRENKGHYCSNYQSLNSGIEKELEYMEMYYMEDCDNLYVLKRYDHFYKLFYGLGGEFDFSNFPKSVKNGVVVCDIIEIEGKEKQAKAVESLKKAGFRDYKKYHMWECTGIKFKIPSFKNYEITDDKNLERLSHVYTIFDEYSDMLPVRRMFPDYIENRHTFSCFKKEGTRAARSIMWKGIRQQENLCMR